jgi:acetylglutamate kinase
MQQYDEETIVIKYGGHAMGAEETAKAFARDIVLLEQTAINPVVVHGGGPQIATMLKRLGIQSEFAAGLRITDAATIEIVEMVLAGSVNKQLVGYINEAGGKAVGLSGKDGNMVKASKTTRTMVDPDSNIEKAIDLGFVGDPDKVDLTLLNQLIGYELIPVLAPLATSHDGQTLNVNADTFAGAVAGALKAKRLLLLTDVPGVLDKSKKLIPELSVKDARKLIADGNDFRRHDPEGRDLHLRAGTGRAGRRHHRRQDAARGAARIVHQPGHRHADPQVTRAISPTACVRAPLARKNAAVWETHDPRAAGAALSLFVSSLPAFADLKLCNRMSYVVEAAIGIDDKSATARAAGSGSIPRPAAWCCRAR